MPFVQAALAGYTDYPMRKLARQFGCPLVFTGVMLDQIALHPRAIHLPKFHPYPDEHPIAAQILGNDPRQMAQAAAVFEKMGYDMIDLNFACPVQKVLSRQRGGFLMQKPAIVREALQRVRDAVRCPIGLKIRIGFDDSPAAVEDFWQIVQAAAQLPVDLLAVHGRTVVQKYKGKADWTRIGQVKQHFGRLVVFGSGDILDAPTALARKNAYGVDGVMIARGAVGNPWIFPELAALWHGAPMPPAPTLAQQAEVMLRHFEWICQICPPRKAVPYFRKFVSGYSRRHPERKKTLLALMAAQTADQLIGVIKGIYGV